MPFLAVLAAAAAAAPAGAAAATAGAFQALRFHEKDLCGLNRYVTRLLIV
jgi:hypothetical protein